MVSRSVDDGVGGRVRRFVDAHALTVGAAGTAVVLLLVLYVPVGVVFAEAFTTDGVASLSRFGDVFTDAFYFGDLAAVLASPLAFDAHVAALAGFLGGFGVRVAALGPIPYPVPVLPTVQTGLFGFTAWQALLSTAASVVVGLPAAYVLANFEFRGRKTLRSVTILPFVLPGILVATGFYAAFGQSGLLNDVLGVVGLGQSLLETNPLFVVILAHAFYNAPLIARVTTGAWEAVDARMVETARALGASRRRAFRDVVLPQLLPAVLAGALLTFIFTFMTFPIVLALGGLQLATVEVWLYARIQQLDYAITPVINSLRGFVPVNLIFNHIINATRTHCDHGQACRHCLQNNHSLSFRAGCEHKHVRDLIPVNDLPGRDRTHQRHNIRQAQGFEALLQALVFMTISYDKQPERHRGFCRNSRNSIKHKIDVFFIGKT